MPFKEHKVAKNPQGEKGGSPVAHSLSVYPWGKTRERKNHADSEGDKLGRLWSVSALGRNEI